jgi:iron complex outermembrane receptor protein
MRPAIRLLCALTFALLLIAAPAPGQPAQRGTIEGRVFGPDGQPVPGVTVLVRSGGADLAVRVVSDDGGVFRIAQLPGPGTYQLAAAIGSLVETGPTVTLTPESLAATAEIRLKLGIAEQVSVTADVWTLPVDAPNSTVSRTFEQLRAQNLFNPEDALRAVPSTTIRKRYIGDRNALIGGRSFGTLQPSRALVYLDGYLLSNFLGRFDAPRWNMVTPEALERVDVMYGPFSAVHAGNSMGTTIVMTERQPTRLEWGLRTTGASQRLTEYGDSDRFPAGQLSAYAGGSHASGLWGAVAFNHQDSISQPMQWFNVVANADGVFPAATGPATNVEGIRYDVDPRGLRRAVFGPNGGAFDHTVQDAVKLRGGYSRAGHFDVSVLAATWRNNTENRNATFLRDSSGTPVWQGRVSDGTNQFTIPPTAFAPSNRDEWHSQLGLTARTRRPQGWNGTVTISDYRILDDVARLALAPDPVAASGGNGTATRRDGTGWATFEAQATRTAVGSGRHTVTVGAHRNAYRLTNVVRNSTDWRRDETTVAQEYLGRTGITALYAQDVIALRDDLKLTAGWRAEWFATDDGSQRVRVGTCAPGLGAACSANGDGTFDKSVAYDRRTLVGQSPKLSLTWNATQTLLVRASAGRAVRFPNVDELYNGTVTATSVIQSDPNLQAERSNAAELSAERFWSRHTVRATFFIDDVRDAILRQSDTTVTPTVTRTSNVDRVRTPGVELVWLATDVGVRNLTIEGNATFSDSKVIENTRDPLMVGKYWLRVPKTRGTLQMTYRPTPRWMGSVMYRHQGRAFNDVYNLDVNPDVYGGVSRVNQVDVRASFKPLASTEFAFGIDNVGDSGAYQSHPFPGRTMFFELRLASR